MLHAAEYGTMNAEFRGKNEVTSGSRNYSLGNFRGGPSGTSHSCQSQVDYDVPRFAQLQPGDFRTVAERGDSVGCAVHTALSERPAGLPFGAPAPNPGHLTRCANGMVMQAPPRKFMKGTSDQRIHPSKPFQRVIPNSEESPKRKGWELVRIPPNRREFCRIGATDVEGDVHAAGGPGHNERAPRSRSKPEAATRKTRLARPLRTHLSAGKTPVWYAAPRILPEFILEPLIPSQGRLCSSPASLRPCVIHS